MSEGHCVLILNGKYAGQEGVISMIDGRDVFVAVGKHNTEIYEKLDLDVVDCREEDES